MGAFVLIFVIRMAGATMEQKEAAEAAVRLSEDRFRSLIQNSSDVTMIIDQAGVFPYLCPPSSSFSAPARRPRRANGHGLRPPGRPGRSAPAPRRGVPGIAGHPVLLQFRMVRRDGSRRDVEAVISNQLDRPSVAGYVTNVRDITERKKFEELLSHRALHDPLTGLANRQLILDRADQMLARRGAPVPRWPRSSSTSTTSRTPTTPWDTRRATGSSRPSPAGSSGCSAPATRWAGSAATSSSSWPRACR